MAKLSGKDIGNIRKACREDFTRFLYLLWLDSGYTLEPFHEEWIEFTGRRRFSLILAPRGFAKSAILTEAYALWLLARNPDTRILIVGATHNKAVAFLRAIRLHIEHHKLLCIVFPELCRPAREEKTRKWNDAEIDVAGKSSASKGTSITARGIGGDIISKHYDVILADDLVEESNARMSEQREKLMTWFYTSLLPTLEPDGELRIIGTRYHYMDLYGKLIGTDDEPGAFYESHLISQAITDSGESLWPLRFPLTDEDAARLEGKPKSLHAIKEESGSIIFNAQYQNDVRAMKGALFKPEWIQTYDALSPNRDYAAYMGMDLAISKSETSDYTAIVTVLIDKEGFIFVAGASRARLSFYEQQQYLQAIYLRWLQDDRCAGPLQVGIEATAYQQALPDEMKRKTSIPIKAVKPTVDKVTRAHQLSALMEAGKVFLHKSLTELREELLLFPEAAYDDLVDALIIAVILAIEARSPAARGTFIIDREMRAAIDG